MEEPGNGSTEVKALNLYRSVLTVCTGTRKN